MKKWMALARGAKNNPHFGNKFRSIIIILDIFSVI